MILPIDEITKLRDEATPGPWRLYDDLYSEKRPGLVIMNEQAADGAGNCYANCGGMGIEQAPNDAKLIAAAPDLADTAIEQDARIRELEDDIEDWESSGKDQQIIELEAERDRLRDVVYDLFNQGCLSPTDMYDHRHISAYEDTQELLLELGKIKPEECVYDAALAEGEE